jgi:hypothetical protein
VPLKRNQVICSWTIGTMFESISGIGENPPISGRRTNDVNSFKRLCFLKIAPRHLSHKEPAYKHVSLGFY